MTDMTDDVIIYSQQRTNHSLDAAPMQFPAVFSQTPPEDDRNFLRRYLVGRGIVTVVMIARITTLMQGSIMENSEKISSLELS